MIDASHPEIYKRAFQESLENFRKKDPMEMAGSNGGRYSSEDSEIIVKSLGQTLRIRYPEGEIFFQDGIHKPLWSWRLTVLNALSRADGSEREGKLISYRELENGNVFYSAFNREAILPLNQLVNNDLKRLEQSSRFLGAVTERKDGCFSAVFNYLPHFPVYLRIWEGDDEVPGSANILFDAGANRYMHTEDIAVAGELVSKFLIKAIHNLRIK